MGKPVRRREDARLVTGAGAYVDDVPAHGAWHAAFVRSPYPHARIEAIDPTRAEATPGVRFVLLGRDMPAPLHAGNPLGLPLPPNHPDRHLAPVPHLAVDQVVYVGQPVAMVVADTPAEARDAAELVAVEYEPLPPIADARAALEPGAALVHPELHTNLAFRYVVGTPEAETDAALERADHVLRFRVVQPRLASVPLEPRATLAQYDAYANGLVVWASTQGPHGLRHEIAESLGIPEQKVRVITRDVGGGFGSKNFLYSDEAALMYAAWTRRCSLRWAETRSENLQMMAQGRGMQADVAFGFERDGAFTAIKVEILADVGGYVGHEGPIPAISFSGHIAGPYRIPTATAVTRAVYTNATPIAPYRGAGRPEGAFVVERAVDLAARELGMDPAELRRRNFISPEQFPYTTPTRLVYDSGDYRGAFERALSLLNYPTARREQEQLRAEGRLIGIGIGSFVESSAPLGWESGTVRVDRSGKATLLTGSSSHGQGHHTTFAQIVADTLGLPLDAVEVIHGDTQTVPVGIGTFGSRSAALGGSAALGAARRVRDKMQKVASGLLEAAVEDVEARAGRFQVAGVPSRSVPFSAVAAACYGGPGLPPGTPLGLDETEFFHTPLPSFPFGTHVAEVEVDRHTGRISIRRYVAVDDCGTVINPLLVAGQVLGGVAQGLGQALFERMVYDTEGQLLSGTLGDYAVPRATNMPVVELAQTVTPSPTNPLGAKGVGEAGTVAAPAALVNAVVDALAPLGITHLDMPLSADRLWEVLQVSR